MNEDEWFEAAKQKVRELHGLCDEMPRRQMGNRARKTAGVLDAISHITSYIVSCNSWEMKYLLPYDARELEDKWKNGVSKWLRD